MLINEEQIFSVGGNIMNQNRWMPLVAGIGIGAVGATAAGMMKGNGGQLKKFIPQLSKMTTNASGGESSVTSGLTNVTSGQQQNSQDESEQYS